MFSALSQGGLVYIVDKTDGLKYKTGEIVSITQSNTFSATNYMPNGSLMLKVKVDGNTIDYPEIPRNGSVASYNNGSTFVCDSKQTASTQIEIILQETKEILSKKSYYEQLEKDCEDVLKTLNPIFAKDKERDDRINGLDSKVTSMETKLDKILNVLSNNSNSNSNPNLKL